MTKRKPAASYAVALKDIPEPPAPGTIIKKAQLVQELQDLLAGDQAAATPAQVRDRLLAAKSTREVEQWKAIKLIADLANATLRQWRMEPGDLDDTIRTIRRTAELASRRDLGAQPRRSKKERP